MGNTFDHFARTSMRISPRLIPMIEGAVLGPYPEEACGLLLGTFRAQRGIRVDQIVQLPNNVVAEKRRRYQIHPRLLLEWERIADANRSSIVGFFHSHPDHEPRPSDTDAKLAWPGYAYLIAGVSRSS